MNLSYAGSRRICSESSSHTYAVGKKNVGDSQLIAMEFPIRSVGRQVFGSTKNFPFHDPAHLNDFKK